MAMSHLLSPLKLGGRSCKEQPKLLPHEVQRTGALDAGLERMGKMVKKDLSGP